MDARSIEIAETVPASRKLGEADARKLVRAADRIVVAKGKKLSEFEGGTAKKDIVAAFLGPTGNLRAPTVVAGNTVLVGFNEDVYDEVLVG